MRKLSLPCYEPFLPAPERTVLTLLHATLGATEHAIRHAHPLAGSPSGVLFRDDPGGAAIRSAARLIVGRCIELRELVDHYDNALDQFSSPEDDQIPY